MVEQEHITMTDINMTVEIQKPDFEVTKVLENGLGHGSGGISYEA